MTSVNNPTVNDRVAFPTQPQGLPQNGPAPTAAPAHTLSAFVQDHFVDGGKLGVSLAVMATRIAHGFAQANTEILTARCPEIQRHIAELPTALRAAIVNGGDVDTRNILRAQIAELSADASLAARTGAAWGVTGLAYLALPMTVAAGYALGAGFGATRANRMITDALDNGNPQI